MWKRVEADGKESILAVDEQLLLQDNRVSVIVRHGSSGNPGSTLMITLADSEKDAGQYICEMGTKVKHKIKHTVTIRGK